MLINLKTLAVSRDKNAVKIALQERLPQHIAAPCEIDCHFEVRTYDNYYLLALRVSSNLVITCQRCMTEFAFPYANQITIAICNSEVVAERLMGEYECIVSTANQINLDEIVTDELHLYAPLFHLQSGECNQEISKFIGSESE